MSMKLLIVIIKFIHSKNFSPTFIFNSYQISDCREK